VASIYHQIVHAPVENNLLVLTTKKCAGSPVIFTLFAETQKALCFDALIEKRVLYYQQARGRANTPPYNSTH
jgi:hypothetical protein